MMDLEKNLKVTLKRTFGDENYSNQVQGEAILNIFEAKRDIIVQGHGKSLCYMLPVLVKDNSFIIVISPRVSYIKRCTDYFTQVGIETNYLTSNTSRNHRLAIEKQITSARSAFKLLYITPFQYETSYFKNIMNKVKKHEGRLFYIAIDQAENILSSNEILRNQYNNLDLKIICVPIIALSASPSKKIQRNLIEKFRLKNPKIYTLPVSRKKDTLQSDVTTKRIRQMDEEFELVIRSDKENLEKKSSSSTRDDLSNSSTFNKHKHKTADANKILTGNNFLSRKSLGFRNKIQKCNKSRSEIRKNTIEVITIDSDEKNNSDENDNDIMIVEVVSSSNTKLEKFDSRHSGKSKRRKLM